MLRRSAGRRNARRVGTLAVLSLLLWQWPVATQAGESFLSRNPKAPEAVPYGRGFDATPPLDTTPTVEASVPATPSAAPQPTGNTTSPTAG